MFDVSNQVLDLIKMALAEDGADKTSELTIPETEQAEAKLIAKQQGILCGLDVFKAVFQYCDPKTRFESYGKAEDGEQVLPDSILLSIQGNARSILRAERVALNFLQYLSGIATRTAQYVDRAGGALKILDTRKTLPGYRDLQKYSVRTGGGHNHRRGLDDMILVKDNHIVHAGGIVSALEKVKHSSIPVEVEVKNLKELDLACNFPVTRIMLDNFSNEQIEQAVAMVNGKIPLEVSGNVTLDRISWLAKCGVEYVSVGALTHSVEAMDLSLEFVSNKTHH